MKKPFDNSLPTLLLIGGLASIMACSSSSAPVDAGQDGARIPDRARPDAPGDGTRDRERDAPADGPDDLAVERAADLRADASLHDLALPPLYGLVSRSASPVLDAKGTLHVGLYFPGIMVVQLAGTTVTADLSAAGSTVMYGIPSPPTGDFVLFAFLDDNTSAAPPFLLPDPGDLAMSAPVPVKVGTVPQRVDLVLDKLEGAIPDGGVSVGALQGKITSSVPPAGDGKGTIYLSLHTQLPPDGQVAGTTVNDADLSSIYASSGYFLTNLPPGNYYLRAYLDDDGNFNPFLPGPDPGDLVQTSPLQVHVVAGATTQVDVQLDQVKP